jgi:hypothetical protein
MLNCCIILKIELNKTIMKNIYIILLLTLPLIISSCDEEFLTEDARTQLTDGYLNSAVGFESALNGTYSVLRFHCERDRWAHMTGMGTDFFKNGFDGGAKYFQFYNNNLNSRTGNLNHHWNRLYGGINAANAVISRAAGVLDMDGTTKNIRVGEAKFLRAHFYFNLVQQWGAVHLTLEETQGVETEATRASVAAVYDAIINDLNDAIAVLPDTPSPYGRATKPAAEHQLALVYLTRAGAGDYTLAAQLAQRVINDYSFQLLDFWPDIHKQGETEERHSEVVFAIQNSPSTLTAGITGSGSGYGAGNSLHSMWLMKYDDLPGLKRDIANGRPWARMRPTDYVLSTLFDKDIDIRYASSFKQVFYCNDPGTYNTINGNTMTLALGDTALLIVDEPGEAVDPNTAWTDARIATLGYSVYTLDLQTPRVYSMLSKYLDPHRSRIPEMRGSRDLLLFRLGETYLIAAEALMMDGNSAQAAVLINTLRRRAAIAGATDAETAANQLAMEITAGDLDIDFILDERGRELLGEMHDYFDLIRTGKFMERLALYNPGAAELAQPHHALRPIPQNQIDRTSNEFGQNPGY